MHFSLVEAAAVQEFQEGVAFLAVGTEEDKTQASHWSMSSITSQNMTDGIMPSVRLRLFVSARLL